MSRPYPIEILDQKEMIFYYPAELSYSTGAIMQIAYGTLSTEAKCYPHPDGKNIISIPKKMEEALRIPKLDGPLHIFQTEHTIHLGPLVGIFTSGFTPFKVRPIGERSLFFSKLLSVKKSVGAHAFVFGEEHINWKDGTIRGLFYQENGWETLEVPFPPRHL